MNRLKALFSSFAVLITGIIVSAGAALALLVPASRFIATESTSTETNFYLIGAVMILIVLLALFEAALAVRILWGREAISGERREPPADQPDEEVIEVRSMRATGTKKAVVFGALLAASILLFDWLAGGVLVSETRRYHVLTQLRSTDGADRKAAALDAIQLVGDEAVAEALLRVISNAGAGREWAVHAAGIRHDARLKDAVADLFQSGSAVERGAAALAMARLEDTRLLRLAPEAVEKSGEHRRDVLIAMGMLGKSPGVTGATDLEACGAFLAKMLEDQALDEEELRLVMWVLGRLESPEGLPGIKRRLLPKADPATLCVAIEALGRIGEAASSDDLMALFDKTGREARCPETVAADFTGHQVLLAGGMPVQERILRDIANIGDGQVKPRLERIATDKSHTAQVRKLAEEIAFQMRYRPASAM